MTHVLPKLLFAVAALLSLQVVAQEYPTKSIRVVVPFPPGGAGDTLARLIAPPVSKALGQNLVVENRTGANTVIATEIVSRAPADGRRLHHAGDGDELHGESVRLQQTAVRHAA